MQKSFWNDPPSNGDINYIFDRPQSQAYASLGRKEDFEESNRGRVC